jgi:RND family efflux transporter MFP subunit
MIAALTNHVWQSTLFAIAAGLLTLILRQERAGIRYWIWFSASVKFLLPFSLLILLGSHLGNVPAARKIQAGLPAASLSLGEFGQPFSGSIPQVPSIPPAIPWAPLAALAVWACGFSSVVAFRVRGWRRIRAVLKASEPAGLPSPVEIRCLQSGAGRAFEPGVVGLFRPILLLPADIQQRLSRDQFDAILAHEMCHVRRRDNVFSAIHMVVEALFWFHPLVWWISGRLLEERERACDEEVLRIGTEPQVYVDGILRICSSYLEPPLSSVAGVAGADLKRRIVAILTAEAPVELSLSRKAAIAVAAVIALASPILIGIIDPPVLHAQSQPPAAAPVERRAKAQATQQSGSDYLAALGTVSALTVSVKPRVDGQLISVTFKEGEVVQKGQVVAGIDPNPYRFQVVQAEGQLARDEAQLQELILEKRPITAPAQFNDMAAQLEGSIKSDRALLDNLKLQLTYAQVTAPITGVAGLRLMDPGNMVHASDPTGLLTITQLNPISVVFNIQEDQVGRVTASLRNSVKPRVEAWDRSNTTRIATGRLAALDNQTDLNTGTVKAKAEFDNRDHALFPNQFVNVRLFLGKE